MRPNGFSVLAREVEHEPEQGLRIGCKPTVPLERGLEAAWHGELQGCCCRHCLMEAVFWGARF